MNQLALVSSSGDPEARNTMSENTGGSGGGNPRSPCVSIATISSGFEKGDFLVREEKGQRV